MPFPAKAIRIDGFADAFNTIRPNQALADKPRPNGLPI